MNKKLVMLGMIVGSYVGNYLPTAFGVSSFSFTAVLTTFIGGAIGIWLGFKLTN